MLKRLSLATQQWGASFASHYLVTQSVAASGAMTLAEPLMQVASQYLRSHRHHGDGIKAKPPLAH